MRFRVWAIARSLQMRKRTSFSISAHETTKDNSQVPRSTTKCIIVSNLLDWLLRWSSISIGDYTKQRELDMMERHWKSRCKRIWWEKWNDTWISTPIHGGGGSPLEGVLLYRQGRPFLPHKIHAAYNRGVFYTFFCPKWLERRRAKRNADKDPKGGHGDSRRR
jgi:hypothetical protein